jgi:hypothetical protein
MAAIEALKAANWKELLIVQPDGYVIHQGLSLVQGVLCHCLADRIAGVIALISLLTKPIQRDHPNPRQAYCQR